MDFTQFFTNLSLFQHSAFVKGALSGFAAAALVDFRAFQSWKSANEAATYDWKTAGWRWFQGAVVGGAIAAGFGQIV